MLFVGYIAIIFLLSVIALALVYAIVAGIWLAAVSLGGLWHVLEDCLPRWPRSRDW